MALGRVPGPLPHAKEEQKGRKEAERETHGQQTLRQPAPWGRGEAGNGRTLSVNRNSSCPQTLAPPAQKRLPAARFRLTESVLSAFTSHASAVSCGPLTCSSREQCPGLTAELVAEHRGKQTEGEMRSTW